MKYSAVKSPNGIIYHLFGPYEGRRNDNHLLRESGLKDGCLVHAPEFCIYGDPVYSVSTVLQSPFSNLDITEKEKTFKKAMASCRECVEWGFADIIRLWAYLDYKRGQKLLNAPLGMEYRVAVLLTNIHICLYGSETSHYFKCFPPLLSEYLKGR